MPSFNHYTPQSDGSYRRSTVSEPGKRPASRQPYPSRPSAPPPEPPKPPPPPKEPEPNPTQEEKVPVSCPVGEGQSILSFLRGLLPRQIDAADLLVISLLLLMNREEDGDGMSPLLTIALYFLL